MIRRATLFIGIDSGPAHMANAVGTPGVILIGSYLGFKNYMPFSGSYKSGGKATIIYGNGPVSHISVERVFQAVNNYLNSGN